MLYYDNYTKRNQVTKSIRFGLEPQGKTLQTIDKKGDRIYDKALYAALDRMKPVIDSFIIDIVQKSLESMRDFDFVSMNVAMTEKDTKTYNKLEKDLFKALAKQVDNTLPNKITASKIKSALFINDVLKEYVQTTSDLGIDKDKALKDIEELKGCQALFSKFLTSRVTALTVSMPKRVVDNFRIYCANIPKVEALLQSGCFDDLSDEISQMKSVSYYNKVLSPKDIDGYNSIISGINDGNKTVEKGLNQRINEYNTRVKNEKLDTPYLRRINPLYKQILIPSDKKFTINSISSDDEVRTVIKEAWQAYEKPAEEIVRLINDKSASSGGQGVFAKNTRLHMLSFYLTGDHNKISDSLINTALSEINEMLKNKNLKPSMKKELEKRIEILPALISKTDYELSALNDAIVPDDKSLTTPSRTVMEMYAKKIMEAYEMTKVCYKILEGGGVYTDRRIKGDRHVQELLVDFFGALTDFREALSIIYFPSDSENDEKKDYAFYNVFEELFENVRLTYKAENLVRNYITKSIKETSSEKQTLFGTTARLRTQWWNGEDKFSKDNAAIILHEDKYYYFILAGDSKPVEITSNGKHNARLSTLKKGQKSFMMLPKILFTGHAVPFFEGNKDADTCIINDESVVRPVAVSRELYDIYKNGLFKKEAIDQGLITEKQYKENIQKLIEKYIEFANAYVQYKKFNFEDITDSTEYNDIGEFFSDVDTHTAAMTWVDIDFKQIESYVESENAYLFLLDNKFLSSEKEHSEDRNLYTRTLFSIFSDMNMDKTTILLNSNPVVFFRPQSIERKVTHKAGSILVNRRTKDGEHIPKRIHETIYKIKNNIESITDKDYKDAKEYMQTHDVIFFTSKYDKSYKSQYMSDKYILQLTYTKNNDVSDRYNDLLNNRVNDDIKDGCNIVSIARSTKDMVYVMVLDSKLQVIKEESLNVIDGIDYYKLLRDTYRDKLFDKKVWVYDTENADLKSAYVDLAITKILEISRKYNAVIVCENIADSVKNKYAYLDNQVFRRFELRLAQRLSDLSFKYITDGEPGSVSNPLQLSNNNANMYQDGVLYYVKGTFTRCIDPETGFINLFDFSRLNSIGAKRQFFAKMESIRYTGDSIIFKFDYNDYPVKIDTAKKDWQIRLFGSMPIYDTQKHAVKIIKDVVNDRIMPLAGAMDVDGNIAEAITDKKVPGVFVDELLKWFKEAIRGYHRQTGSSSEFYRSPVSGKDYDISSTQAYVLAQKFMFSQSYSGDSKDFSAKWINYLQKQ